MVFPSITHTSSDGDATSGPAPALRAYDTGLLLVRLAVGLTMAAHGAQKLFGWFGGGGIHGTARFFTMSGYPAGQAMAVVSGLTETLGGLALGSLLGGGGRGLFGGWGDGDDWGDRDGGWGGGGESGSSSRVASWPGW